ncbi:AraC family transcriptional regulator [Flexivirga endophytica]|uniref:AraC family transcriptional regulator n=1 Tax=Flexivirga endophytica TaxID=1849103 RepID=A0A916T033_9MICO|nr:AraC family transcriptional regulator [Flexivirga endophytica]GGB22382.1 AraC family transcriptional regulator [Flexivirga endophytica]GHB56323.1 AraC family transcriptional regulator [Flexivirga endophytica]
MARQPSIPGSRSYVASGLPHDRVERWEAYNAEALIAVRCATPDGPFRATETNLDLPRLHIATVTGSPHRVTRSADLVERCPTDSIAVYLGLGADAAFTSGGRRRMVRRGELLICNADQPFGREFRYGVGEFAIKVPRSELAGTLGAEVPGALRLLSLRESPAARALARAVAGATRSGAAVPIDELAALELVGVLAAGDRTPPEVQHRVAARAYIEEHLTDQDLSARHVAEAAGISDRQLSRIFAAVELSVPQFIQGRRLELARTLLAAGRAGSTAQAARSAGFASMPHFSRAFQRRFGVTAGAVRRGADD